MTDSKQKVAKVDCNILEFPLFQLDKNCEAKELTVKVDNGLYKLSCVMGLPNFWDRKVLGALLLKLYDETGYNSYDIEFSLYEILQNSYNGTPGPRHYEAIESSLRKWAHVNIDYDGVFLEQGMRISRTFHVIDSVNIIAPHKQNKRTRKFNGKSVRFKARVRINKEFIDQMRIAQPFTLLKQEALKLFTRPLSGRLYEFLKKNLGNRDQFAIDFEECAEKLALSKCDDKYYRSAAIRLIIPAVREINERSDIQIQFAPIEDSRLLLFKKLDKPKNFAPAIKPKTLAPKPNNDDCYAYYLNLPESKRKRIEEQANQDPFLLVITDPKDKICLHMRNKNLYWPTK